MAYGDERMPYSKILSTTMQHPKQMGLRITVSEVAVVACHALYTAKCLIDGQGLLVHLLRSIKLSTVWNKVPRLAEESLPH